MRILSLTQPWATLVAIGAKTIETRSWSPNYRGPLAIHAAKSLAPLGGRRGLHELLSRRVFGEALLAGGVRWEDQLPFGAIVAVCKIDGYAPTGHGVAAGDTVSYIDAAGRAAERVVGEQEHAFGDYSAGRWLWMLADVKWLSTPLPHKGGQGLRWVGDLMQLAIEDRVQP